MKRFTSFLVIITLTIAVLLTGCSKPGDFAGDNAKETQLPNTHVSPTTEPPAATEQPQQTAEPTPEPTPEPTSELGPASVNLVNSPDSTGNTHHASSHYGLHITYNDEHVIIMNYMTMLQHGADINAEPEASEGFDFQAEDLQYFNGLLYFLYYDSNNGVYYLYSYDFENSPVKVSDSTVYHYEIVNGTVYFTKEFVQGPLFSMNIDGSGETQLTSMRAHSFVNDGQSLYFYATDAGTAPGLVKYDLTTGEETTAVFPFYSHNYLVHGGYAYYVIDGTYRSIHRINLSDQTVEDIWLEIPDYTISLNITDGELYILSGNSIYKSDLDGSNMMKIYENPDSLQSGLYIFGDRIYCTDGAYYQIVKTDGSEYAEYSFR
ncbi:MAG: DUF5050 domain-containing protein [Clostridia bacterium]|nr:DUF5050 domain-containing protein [Clostridia bacterium]